MIHRCDQCPGKESVAKYIMEIFTQHDTNDDETVVFKQWCHIEKISLETMQESVVEFSHRLSDQLDSLTTHHYISKAQAMYLKDLKNSLDTESCIILGDFSENFSVLVQDAVQGQHWDNTQATLHPFVVYHLQSEVMKSISLCVISDCMNHNTNTVHAFQTVVTDWLKPLLPELHRLLV